MPDPTVRATVCKLHGNTCIHFRWVKTKYHPYQAANEKEEWKQCVQATDGKNHAIKEATKVEGD